MSKKINPTIAFNKEHYRSFFFRMNREEDAELIEFLDKQPNKAGYLKNLVRFDMKQNKDK